MVLEATTTQKSGYWRPNPETGDREWIEGNFTIAHPKKPKLGGEAPPLPTSLEPIEEPVIPVEPTISLEREEALTFDVVKLARLYGLSATRFVSAEQLTDLSLPPEERTVQEAVPFAQFLTGTQARFLGFDVPEGAVVKMTPMADGEPQFTLVSLPEEEPEAVAELPRVTAEEFEDTLTVAYPDLYERLTEITRGYVHPKLASAEITPKVVDELRRRMSEDYVGFVDDLHERVGDAEAERILRLLGVTEEFILLTLDLREQEARVTDTIQQVFPDVDNLDEFSKLIDADWELFVETIQTGGRSKEKLLLLDVMGFSPAEINQWFSVIRVEDVVDGIKQPLVIDVSNQKAYDTDGNWVGTYNPTTREFTSNPDEVWVKDVWDAFVFGGASLYQSSKQFVVSALPGFLFRDMGQLERTIYGDDWVNSVNAGNQQIRDKFRTVYSKNQIEFDEWIVKHPELATPEFARGDIVERLKTNPLQTILYEFASTAPFVIGVMGTTVAVSVATGNPALGIAAGVAIATPPQAQDAYEALLSAGATEAQAGQLALPIGVLVASIEVIGDLPYLRQVFPAIFKKFSKGAIQEISKRTIASLAKKGLKTFTTVEIMETLEEVAQGAVINSSKRIFDENQEIFEGLSETAIRTLAATAPLALFGAGLSLRIVPPSRTQGLSDAEMKAKGWVQNEKSGNWYETLRAIVKGEEGFVRIPGEPEEIRPEGLRKRIVEGREQTLDPETMEWIDTGPAIPVPEPEPGQPEAGIQAGLFGEQKVVRPPGKGKVVQISMEDQLKLDQARQAAEEAPPEVKEAYEAQAEIEGLKVTHQLDPVVNARFKIGGKNVDLTAFISIREQTFPQTFTVKQAQALFPGGNFERFNQKGTPQYNKVPMDVALDDLTKQFNMTPDEIADRVMAIREEKRRIKQLESAITTVMTEKPLTPRTELTTVEVTDNWATLGQPKYTLKQAEALVGFMGDYVLSENVVDAFELTRELQRETKAERVENAQARAQELIVKEGLSYEEALNQAAREMLPGELPVVTTDFFQNMANELRATSIGTLLYCGVPF